MLKGNQAQQFSEVIEVLERMYNHANLAVFERRTGEKITLPVYITVQSKGKRNAYGWVTLYQAWQDSEGNGVAYELNIAAETLGRPSDKTYLTLLHEMVHLFNLQKGIKDCAAKSGRHNANFGKTCDLIGLKNACDPAQNGYHTHFELTESGSEIQEAYQKYYEAYPADYEKIAVNRAEQVKVVKKRSVSNQIKYICPCCGTSVRATKRVNIKCTDCDCDMVQA